MAKSVAPLSREDQVNAAAVSISEYLQAPPSTVGTIERLIARHCFSVEPGKDRRNALLRVARMALQQFEFAYGKRKRGWDAVFLMDELKVAIANAETAQEADPANTEPVERRVKLLLRYVDHLRGCASYTNGGCTCGFENAMQDDDFASASHPSAHDERTER